MGESEINDNLYSFFKTCYPNLKEISIKKEKKYSKKIALDKLSKIFCKIKVAKYDSDGKSIYFNNNPEHKLIYKYNGPNHQSENFIDKSIDNKTKRFNNYWIREALYNAFQPVDGKFGKIHELSEYFKNDKDLKIPSEDTKFISYFKSDSLEDTDGCDKLYSFLQKKKAEDPYLWLAWIFAFLCFPKKTYFQNAYDRNLFFQTLRPYLGCSKKTDGAKYISYGSNDCYGRISEENIGRDKELQQIEELMNAKCYHLALYGLGGIGKTYICRKIFWKYYDEYIDGVKYVAWVNYDKTLNDSMSNTFFKSKVITPEGYGKKEDFFANYDDEPILKEMYKEFNQFTVKAKKAPAEIIMKAFDKLGRRLLVIIDNANTITEKEIKQLNNCSCRIILTTRHEITSFKSIHIEGPDTDYCCELYRKNCSQKPSSKYTKEENDHIRQIVELANRHTLAIELIAKAQRNSNNSVKYMLKLLKEKGFSLSDISETIEYNGENSKFIVHFSKLYDISNIEKDESLIRIMRNFSLLDPITPISPTTIKKWFELENFDDFNKLINLGWLNKDENNYLSIHPVISAVIRDKYKNQSEDEYSYSEPLIKAMIDSFDDMTDINDFVEYARQFKSVVVKFNDIKEDKYYSLLMLTVILCSGVGDIDFVVKYSYIILEAIENEKPENDEEKGGLELIRALLYHSLYQHTEAIESFETALKLSATSFSEKPLSEARLYEYIGNNYFALFDYKNALKYNNNALEMYIMLSGENSIDSGRVYENIALILASIGKHEEASEYMNKAESILKNDETGIAKSSIDLVKGAMYYLKNDFQNSKEYVDRALAPGTLYSINPMLSTTLASLRADIHIKTGEYDKAIEIINNASEPLTKNIKMAPLMLIDKHITKAKIHFEKGEYNLFVESYNQALKAWHDNYSEIDHSSQVTRNTVSSIIITAIDVINYFSSNQSTNYILQWYYSFIGLIDPYIVDVKPEAAIDIYYNFANNLLIANDIQNSLIYYKKVIELSERFQLQGNSSVLEAQKQIEEIEKSISET